MRFYARRRALIKRFRRLAHHHYVAIRILVALQHTIGATR